MKKNRIINYQFLLDDEMEYKLNFMSWAYNISVDKIIEDLLLAFQNMENLSTIYKRNTPINFFYAKDRIQDKKYKVIMVKKEK